MRPAVALLRDAVRAAAQVDRSKIALGVGLRATVGVALCLVVGRATGHTVAGVTATIGALNGGMASHQGAYRSRAAVILAAAAACGFCAAVGATLGHLYGPDIVVTGVIAFAAALLVSLGPAGTVVGIQAVVGLVVFSQFSFPVSVAARDGGLVLLGGVVQAALVVALWPLRRFPAERRVLSGAFRTLAAYAGQAAQPGGSLLQPDALDGLDRIWSDAQPFGRDEIAAHRALAAQADRLRLELLAVMSARTRLRATGEDEAAATIDEVLARAASVLDEVATAIADGRAPAGWQEDRLRFRSARHALLEAAEAGHQGWASAAAEEAESRVDALAGQLRAVLRTAAAAAGVSGKVLDEVLSGGTTPAPRRPTATWVQERLGILRSNLTFTSQSFRHAARMSITLMVAVAVSHAFGFGHRYWLPMTTLLVLRPDFTSTIVRGLSRVVGTLIGAGVVTLALAELRPSPDWLIGLVVVLCLPATSLVLANYAVFSACIASLVVTLLAFSGNPELNTAGDRSIYTLLGAGLALVAYLAWPTWEGASLADTLAVLARAEGRYASAVLGAWADPERADRSGLQRARLAARVARTNAEAAVTRWLAEPRHAGPLGRDTVQAFMAAIRSCVQAVLTLHAELPPGGPGYPEASQLGRDIEKALDAVADFRRKGASGAAALPPLRKEQLALADRLTVGSGAGNGDPRAVVLAGESDLLVDGVDALGHLLLRGP